MRYALLIYESEAQLAAATPEDWEEMIAFHNAFAEEAAAREMDPSGAALQPTATAQTVRFENKAATMVTDGPYAETKEQLGGFYLLDCETIEEAIAMAKKLPLTVGSVEVRPLLQFD
jgi:hypothetical protein